MAHRLSIAGIARAAVLTGVTVQVHVRSIYARFSRRADNDGHRQVQPVLAACPRERS
jgi:hypothetical protein